MVSFFSHGCIHMDSVAGDSEFEVRSKGKAANPDFAWKMEGTI